MGQFPAHRTNNRTAIMTLAAELPASVLADLIGVHDVTAARWARRAKRDWHTYIAHRKKSHQRPGGS